MKLKIKNLNWYAGRPVVFLNDKMAKKLNVFVNDRVLISNTKKVYAVVDIFPRAVREREIGLSRELTKILKMKGGSFVEVTPSEISNATILIKKKMDGKELTKEELEFLISEIVHNNLTEAEIAYFTSAEKLRGMTIEEVIDLTRAMVKTGEKLKFRGKYIADKHSIGGIAGNRTTPLLVSICAAAGLILPKTSSRAITSAAGTADVIETIANVELSKKEIKKVIKKTGACLVWGGALGLSPSDDKIIRVERLLNIDVEPQLLASIMSKKISAGSKYLLIDIPYGSGAKVQSKIRAERLAKRFHRIAEAFKIKVKTVFTDGTEPIGDGIGPNLEMRDILLVLENDSLAPADLKKKALFLSAELMSLCGIKNAKKVAEEILSSGKAYEKFKDVINAQNKAKDFERRVRKLRTARFSSIFRAKKSGRRIHFSNKGINSLCRILGTPENKAAGIYLLKKKGPVKKGEKIMILYSESKKKIEDGKKFIKEFEPVEIR